MLALAAIGGIIYLLVKWGKEPEPDHKSPLGRPRMVPVRRDEYDDEDE